jgi:hypothetical protein
MLGVIPSKHTPRLRRVSHTRRRLVNPDRICDPGRLYYKEWAGESGRRADAECDDD